MKKYIQIFTIITISAILSGCASTPQGGRPYGGSNAVEKAIGGAVLGGIAGGIIGHQSGERDAGIAVGAATGAVGGYALGNEQDKRIVRSQGGGQRVVVRQPPGGGRGITCRPSPQPRGRRVRTPPMSSYDRYGNHSSGDFRIVGAPPPRPPRPTW